MPDDRSNTGNSQFIEMFVFETMNLVEQLEEILLNAEKNKRMSIEDVNEIFRIMHTIKGSAAMMSFNSISKLAHSMEDLFYYVREKGCDVEIDISALSDKILESLDFIKEETEKIKEGKELNGDETKFVNKIKDFLEVLRKASNKCEDISILDIPVEEAQERYTSDSSGKYKKYIAHVFFEEGAQMENVRAYSMTINLKEICRYMVHIPQHIIEDEETAKYIIENGFKVYMETDKNEQEIDDIIEQEIFIGSVTISEEQFDFDSIEGWEDKRTDKIVEHEADNNQKTVQNTQTTPDKEVGAFNVKQNIISVNVNRLDQLMDIVGEIVITESMVIKNKDLSGLVLDSFNKAARQLRKLTDELQDIVMAIRMVPISIVFSKMNRIVRDMSKKLGKDVELEIIGEETEVDKNIIDNLADPIMHIIRNSMDHGIEDADTRLFAGKPEKGTIILQAKSTSGEVLIKVIDDGGGIDKEKVIEKAKNNGLLTKDESELTDREIYNLIFLPGFSTNDEVTEFSGRGVGMDVVKKNIEKVGGSVYLDSKKGEGTTVNIKIPLTLAIVAGMEISVGKLVYTVPTASIKESFKVNMNNVVLDTSGNEMIMVRGSCYPIVRLHNLFNVDTQAVNLEDGIIIMVESDDRMVCLFADAVLGEQQVVVKPLPTYLFNYISKEDGVGGCTILGDGNISLILDIPGIINRVI